MSAQRPAYLQTGLNCRNMKDLKHYCLAKEVKVNLYLLLCQMCNSNSMWGMPWPLTVATQYHAQFPEKGRAIKGLVVCNNYALELTGLVLGCYNILIITNSLHYLL